MLRMLLVLVGGCCAEEAVMPCVVGLEGRPGLEAVWLQGDAEVFRGPVVEWSTQPVETQVVWMGEHADGPYVGRVVLTVAEDGDGAWDVPPVWWYVDGDLDGKPWRSQGIAGVCR